MTTTLATQRNFLISAPASNVVNSNGETATAILSCQDIKREIITNEIMTPTSSPPNEKDPQESGDDDHNSTTNTVELDDVLAQKNGEISIINVVVPMDASDSSNEENGSMTDISAIKDNVEISLAQQVGGQVTLLQSQNPDISDSPPQFITVTVSTQDSVVGQGSYQVQYVDTELYHSNSSQSQMTYPFCPVADYQANNQSYAYATSGNYTTAATNTPTSHSSALPYLVPVEESLLLNSSSQAQSRDSPHNLTEIAYIQDNTPQTPTSTTSTILAIGAGPGSVDAVSGGSGATSDNEQIPLVNANKIASATIKWLSRNYETADAVSLPRSTLYNHYMQHCNEHKLEPVNAASFGKLIRSVFSGLRTRRLGTRGNSKYHYYGIRIRADSALTLAMDDRANSQNFQGHSNSGGGSGGGGGSSGSFVGGGSAGAAGATANNKGRKGGPKMDTFEACAQYLGDGSGAIPVFPQIELDNTFNNELTLEDVETFRSMYREHYESFLDAVLSLEFNTIEFLWRDFWRSSDNNNLDECEEEKYLSKTKLYLLCHCDGVEKFIKQVDYQFYQNLVDVLIPDVLRSIPNVLTQAIRNFAKNLEIWLCESMIGVPERVVQIKSSAVSALCQTLRRYTSLNHLAQAARAVLQNNSQISQMLNDLNRVDFHNVQEQAAWVCQCDTSIVQRLENDFKAALQQQSTLEQWASWLRLVVDSALEEYRGKNNYAKAARQFLLKWSFYSSMVIRDLTLRSASSFGSFHLIRLLYDEYMFFLIEHKVAEAQQKTAIAVISDRMQKENDFEFEYPLDFIDHSAGPTIKRMKHE